MKKLVIRLVLIAPLALGICVTSCKKDDDSSDSDDTQTPSTTLDPCNGDDGFCMTYGGTEKSGPASLIILNSNKVRVFWENGTGNDFEQVELDVYSVAPGTFDVNNNGLANSAFVQYYSATSGTNNAAYGTVTVTALDTAGAVTGTFKVTMNDSTKITNGKFTNIMQ